MRVRDRAAKLGLGTVQLGLAYGVSNSGGQVSPQEALRLLTAASDAGIGAIDTAQAYGTSESVIGQWIAATAGGELVTL